MSELRYDNINSTLSNIVDNELSIADSMTDRVSRNLQLSNLNRVNITVFGNDITTISPKKMGRLYTYFFINQQPLITIGPQCNFIFTLS